MPAKPASNRPEPAAPPPEQTAAQAGASPPAKAPAEPLAKPPAAARPPRAAAGVRRAPRAPEPAEADARFRRLLLGLLVCMAIVTALALTARAPM